MDYFHIKGDFESKRVWFLDEPRLETGGKIDIWAFSSGRRLAFEPRIIAPIQRQGDVADITFSHYRIPYILPRIGQMMEAFAGSDIQRIAARLETGDPIEILNVLPMLDAFDHDRSEATYKKAGVEMVLKLRIMPENAGDHHVFRLAEWHGPVIVSGLILEQLRKMGASGFEAVRVS